MGKVIYKPEFTEKARRMWLRVIAEEEPESSLFKVLVNNKLFCLVHKAELREYKDLKPHYYNVRECPFCGGDAELVKSGNDDYGYILVECNQCKARGKSFYIGSELKGRRKPEESEMAESAVKAWNKRVQLV